MIITLFVACAAILTVWAEDFPCLPACSSAGFLLKTAFKLATFCHTRTWLEAFKGFVGYDKDNRMYRQLLMAHV